MPCLPRLHNFLFFKIPLKTCSSSLHSRACVLLTPVLSCPNKTLYDCSSPPLGCGHLMISDWDGAGWRVKSSHIRLGKPGVTGDLSNVPWIIVLFPFDFYVKATASIIKYVHVLGTTLDKHEANAAPAFMPPHSLCFSWLRGACIIPRPHLQTLKPS